jgi:hypothetical protein
MLFFPLGVPSIVSASSAQVVGYYPFEGDVRDYSGNNHHGIFHGGTAVFTADQWGNPNSALIFDGINDYVELPNEVAFDLQEFTLVAVLKVSHHDIDNYVLSKGPEFGNYTMDINDDLGYWPGYAGIAYQTQGGNYSMLASRYPVPLNESFCVAVSLSKNDSTLKTYFNGELVYSSSSASVPSLNNHPVTIGYATFQSAGTHYFDGIIDEVVILDGEIPQAEINQYCQKLQLETPILLSPRDGAVLDNNCDDISDIIEWNFDWSAVRGATKYQIYVIHVGSRYPLIDATVTSSSYHFSNSGGYIIDRNRYDWTWKVRAGTDGGEWSEWSEVRYFDVELLNTDCRD